ncbi:DUF3592 domain-containing protein [Dyadobacter aurulentus]|uniref:DUF3592 domain-containing protein n=1 Tax=Dyadobacter sp. UC 10 TaxID=2605428 RepID=UPI001CED3736|nr:DUF3592 domain-containing protein [Dyadobacter sp. UC 10]
MEDTDRAIGATIILICMVAYSIYSTFRKRRREERKKKILKEGVEANATVLKIEPTGEYLNNQPEFQVKVKVQSAQGKEFVAEMTEVLSYSRYEVIRQGSSVLVKYDPEYVRRAILCN